MEPAVCVHRLNLSTVLGILKIKIVNLDFLRQFEARQLKYSYEYALDWISEVLLREWDEGGGQEGGRSHPVVQSEIFLKNKRWFTTIFHTFFKKKSHLKIHPSMQTGSRSENLLTAYNMSRPLPFVIFAVFYSGEPTCVLQNIDLNYWGTLFRPEKGKRGEKERYQKNALMIRRLQTQRKRGGGLNFLVDYRQLIRPPSSFNSSSFPILSKRGESTKNALPLPSSDVWRWWQIEYGWRERERKKKIFLVTNLVDAGDAGEDSSYSSFPSSVAPPMPSSLFNLEKETRMGRMM